LFTRLAFSADFKQKFFINPKIAANQRRKYLFELTNAIRHNIAMGIEGQEDYFSNLFFSCYQFLK